MSHRSRSHFWHTTVTLLRVIVLTVPLSAVAADEALFDEDDLKIRLWNSSADLRGGFGYKDNVLLSHTNAQGSAFWMSGAELMIFRLPTHGWHFHFFADVSDVRYFNSPAVDNEQVAVAAAQLAKEFGHGWKSNFGVNYLFQNQVFDFSDAYTNQASVGQVVGHTVAPRLTLRKTIDRFWIEGEFSGTRQWLDEPLDSYWQFGPRAGVGYGWSRGSELTLSYQYSRLDYDNREQVDAAVGSLTNTALALDSHSVELSLTQVWDEKRHWQTVTSLGFEANTDNGDGFYNYDHYRLSQQIRYRDADCEITARARLAHFDYSTQTVSAADTASRRKTMLNLTLRVERKLSKHLKAHASYLWDRSISNLDFDDYQASTVQGGLAVTF